MTEKLTKRMARLEGNQKYLTGESVLTEATPEQLYGRTIEGNIAVVRFEKPILADNTNALLAVYQDPLNRDLHEALSILPREESDGGIMKLHEFPSINELGDLTTQISRGFFDDEEGIPISNGAFQNLNRGEEHRCYLKQEAQRFVDTELYVVKFRNKNDYGTNPFYYRSGIARPEDDPQKYLFNFSHLFDRSVINIKDIISKENLRAGTSADGRTWEDAPLRFSPGTLWTSEIILSNLSRSRLLNSGLGRIYTDNVPW